MTFEPSEILYEYVDVDVEAFDDIPCKAQEDLLVWLNVLEPEDDDKDRLLALYVGDRFRAWNCPLCESKDELTRVFQADIDAAAWIHFGNSINQDWSYRGDRDKYTEEYIAAMCDSCRCDG